MEREPSKIASKHKAINVVGRSTKSQRLQATEQHSILANRDTVIESMWIEEKRIRRTKTYRKKG